MDQDIVFQCKKCEHHLFITSNIKIIEKLPEYDCPNCGEEGNLNWVLSHVGKFEEEKTNYKTIK